MKSACLYCIGNKHLKCRPSPLLEYPVFHQWSNIRFHQCSNIRSFTSVRISGLSPVHEYLVFHQCSDIRSFTSDRISGLSPVLEYLVFHLCTNFNHWEKYTTNDYTNAKMLLYNIVSIHPGLSVFH